jgi:hypothetical protein
MEENPYEAPTMPSDESDTSSRSPYALWGSIGFALLAALQFSLVVLAIMLRHLGWQHVLNVFAGAALMWVASTRFIKWRNQEAT